MPARKGNRRRKNNKNPGTVVANILKGMSPEQRNRVMYGTGAYYLPKRTRISGRGDYTLENGTWANTGGYLGRLAGEAVGGKIGGMIGGWAGRRAFHYPAKLFGSGSYGISNYPTKLAPQIPQFSTSSYDDSVVIAHREYLGDIITSATPGAFKIESYGLNPSEVNAFPWLSNIVQPNFQQFKFEGLVFEFRSFSANALNSTNTALGSVFACINYDYTDEELTSRYEVENTDWSKSAKPSENFLVPVECKTRQTGMGGLLYVINGNNVPPNTDPKTYYLGKLWFGTTGFQAGSVNIGSLYITYKIRLYKPLMTKPLSNALYASYMFSGATNTTAHFGTALVANASNCDSIGLTFSGNIMTISHKRLIVGQTFFFIYYVGSATPTAGVVIPTIATSSGLTGLAYFMNSAGAPYSSSAAAQPQTAVLETNIMYVQQLSVVSNTSDQTITLTGGVYPATATCQVILAQFCGISPLKIGFYNPSN